MQTYLFGEGDRISVKSVSQMRVQLESRRNLHNLQNTIDNATVSETDSVRITKNNEDEHILTQ